MTALISAAVLIGTALLIWLAYSYFRYDDFRHAALFHPKYYTFNWRVFAPRLDRYIGWVHSQPDKEDVHG